MMPVAIPIGCVPSAERMNSPLEHRKVRLRGLGGPAVCGARRTCAPATRRSPRQVRSEHDSLSAAGRRRIDLNAPRATADSIHPQRAKPGL
jgi:hypothetical protein